LEQAYRARRIIVAYVVWVRRGVGVATDLVTQGVGVTSSVKSRVKGGRRSKQAQGKNDPGEQPRDHAF
jgi:hypothetical protein